MPTFESEHGRAYEVDGKHVVWHPEVWDGEDPLPDVRLPLRMKMGVVLDVGESNITVSNENMRALILRIVPAAAHVLDEMDVNDFQDMFRTWLSVYNGTVGLSLGEPSGSPELSTNTEGPLTTTSEPASESRSMRSVVVDSGGRKRTA